MFTRRKFLQTSISGVGAGMTLSSALIAPGKAATIRPSQKPTLRGPILNHDSTAFFVAHSADQMSGTLVDEWVDSLAAAGVGALMSNVNAMRANYASKVWEPDWFGYEPAAGDEQPVLKYLPKDVIPLTRKRLES